MSVRTDKLFQEIFKKLDILSKTNLVKGGNTIVSKNILPINKSIGQLAGQLSGQSVGQMAGQPINNTMRKFYHVALRGSLYLGAVAVIFFIAYSSRNTFSFISETHENIQSHWFTKFIKHPVEHVVTMFRNLFNVFMSPFVEFFENIMHVLTDLVKNLQNIRLMINYLRGSINTFLLDIATMFYGYAKKLSYLFERLKASFMLISKVFDDIYVGMLYLLSIFYDVDNTVKPLFSIIDPITGLIGGIASFF